MAKQAIPRTTFQTEDARKVLPRRAPGAHKWSVGGLLIVAGSPGYVGAAALCAMAAGRAGAGIVRLAVQRSLITPIAAQVPEVGFTILPEGDFGANATRLLDTISTRAEKCAAFVIGPGLGDDDYARDLVAALLGITVSASHHALGFGIPQPAPESGSTHNSLAALGKPILVDADGLNALAKLDQWWNQIPPQSLVLTPHVGELSRLLDVPADDFVHDPAGAALVAAQRFRQVVLLKGTPTLVTDGHRIAEAHDSPTSLATAGTGDILAGTIGALLAQGLTQTDAANLGVYVGARAARRDDHEYRTMGLIASDLPPAIPMELAALETS